MEISRGLAGTIPYAATGAGEPILILAGLWPTTGVDSKELVRGAIAPLRRLATERRLIVFNRRAGLSTGVRMSDFAAEYADAIRGEFGAPVDVVGTSTGGSIAQQLAAEHPDVVRRLVLISSACRLGPAGRQLQSEVAERLRAGQIRSAVGIAGADLAPRGFRTLARALAWTTARRVVGDSATAADLAATLEAEDDFDLAKCEQPIRANTLIIAGGRDRFYGGDLFAETAALIPNSHLQMFSGRGHITVASHPGAQAMITGFVARS